MPKINKPVDCDGCPIKDISSGYCPDKIAKKAKYVFIGETPDKAEITSGEPFTGKSGFVLKNWLIRAVSEMQLAAERNEITYANTLRCLPPEYKGKAYPKGKDKVLAEAYCRKYDQFPDSVHTVVLFGDAPQRVWFPDELDAEDAAAHRLGRDAPGVMGRVGREYFKHNKRWVLAPHPSAILKQPALAQHGQMSIKIAANTDKNTEPDYLKWEHALNELE